MGTNYRIETYPHCSKCGHIQEIKHLGKNSSGCAFIFHAYPEEGLISWKAWLNKIMSDPFLIIDEYENMIFAEDFLIMIKDAKDLKKEVGEGFFLDAEGYSFYNREFS